MHNQRRKLHPSQLTLTGHRTRAILRAGAAIGRVGSQSHPRNDLGGVTRDILVQTTLPVLMLC